MSVLGQGLRLAVGTLTIVPVGQIPPVTRPVAAGAMLLAPVAALPVALVAALLGAGLTLAGVPALVGAALVIGALGLGSRGMHIDGLADTADGFAAGWSRDRALQVMRTGDVGPIGAATLGVVLLAQAAAITGVVEGPADWVLVAWAVAWSRLACAGLCVRGLPSARPDGLGAAVADSVPAWWLVAGCLAAGLSGAGLAMAVQMAWWQPVLAVLVAAGVCGWLARHATRVLGGTTGDVLGAGIELSLLALLVVLSADLSGGLR